MAQHSLQLLMIEDSKADAAIVLEELNQAGYDPCAKIIETAEEMTGALQAQPWDVIICDYFMPRFSALAALQILQESNRDIPFIVVSGSIGEDIAVEAMKQGASDYVMKHNMTRLGVAVTKEIQQSKDRQVLKETEAALLREKGRRENEEFFQLAFVHSSIGMAFTDIQGQYIKVNPAFCEITGYSELELKALNFAHILHPDDLPQSQTLLHQLLADEISGFEVEKRYLKKDGDTVWAHNSVSLVRNNAGQPLHLIVLTQNITERIQAEQAYEESEGRFRKLAEAAPIMINVSDTSGQATYFNNAWVAFTGVGRESLLGYGWLQSVHADDQLHFLQTYQQAIDARQSFQVEARIRDWDGQYRWCLCFSAPRFTSEGEFTGYIGSNVDITSQKQAEQALRDSQVMLERSNKELEAFAMIASHDLKAPVRKIGIFTQTLQDSMMDTLSNESKDYLNRIQRSACKMQNLIDDLLTLSRVGLKETQFEMVNLSNIVDEVINDLQEMIDTLGGKIVIEGLGTLEGDPSQMSQLFQNLIENGLKFHQKEIPPVVKITSRLIDNVCYEIKVQDNGIGIQPAYHSRIFKIFERLHGENKDYPGTGIGLAIVQKIVEHHHGNIRIESLENAGTTFIIQLPVSQACSISEDI